MSAPELTVEELATNLGTKVSTIRLYQRQELLPPPAVRGRVAFYGPGHVARLQLIGRLQARGFSLAAIRALLDTWARGGGIEEILGAEERPAPATAPEVVLTPAELAEVLGAAELEPRLLARAVEVGLVTVEPDGNLRLVDRRFAEIDADITRLTVVLSELLAEHGYTRAECRRMAERLLALLGSRAFGPR